MIQRNYNDTAPATTLTANITNSATSLPVISTAGYPAPPFTIGLDRGTINQEVCLCTSVPDGSHFQVTRGYDGTTAVAHSATTGTVEHCTTSLDFVEANLHHTDITRDDHTQYMLANGARHDVAARHQVGTTIPVGAPGSSAPGDTALTGSTGNVSDAGHRHARESATVLLNNILPIGLIVPYAVPINGSTKLVPAGFIICNGQAVLRATYPALYAAIGNTYGGGDGATTFNVPNLSARTIVGSLPPGQNPGPDLAGNNYTMGTVGGESWHTLLTGELPSHAHGVNDPTHNHNSTSSGFAVQIPSSINRAELNDEFPDAGDILIAISPTTASSSTGISIQSTGGGSKLNIVSSYVTMHFLIKADQ